MTTRLMFATVFASCSLVAGADSLYDTTNVFKVAYGDEIMVDGDLTKAAWKDVTFNDGTLAALPLTDAQKAKINKAIEVRKCLLY